jgi:hypothetical protein
MRRTAPPIAVGLPTLSLSSPVRSDGYEPLSVGLQSWAVGVVDYPRDEVFWHFVSAARRLDAAHQQFERVRAALDSGHVELDSRFLVLGDVELGVIALSRAASMTLEVQDRLGLRQTNSISASLRRRIAGVGELRHAYEHIDARARGQVDRVRTMDLKKAHQAFSLLGDDLFVKRQIRYRRWSLGIDEPATRIMCELRRHLHDGFLEACARESARSP